MIDILPAESEERVGARVGLRVMLRVGRRRAGLEEWAEEEGRKEVCRRRRKILCTSVDFATEEEIVGVGETIERRWKGDKVGHVEGMGR